MGYVDDICTYMFFFFCLFKILIIMNKNILLIKQVNLGFFFGSEISWLIQVHVKIQKRRIKLKQFFGFCTFNFSNLISQKKKKSSLIKSKYIIILNLIFLLHWSMQLFSWKLVLGRDTSINIYIYIYIYIYILASSHTLRACGEAFFFLQKKKVFLF